ncbi:hypothetical protein JCM11251_000761 [Rhodosporidiobolus azoricus]
MAASSERSQFYLFGTPISHSLSPTFHNTVFQALALPEHAYSRHETPTFADPSILSLLKSPSFGGAAVTMPHKLEALQHMDELAPEVKVVGSMNTIVVREDGKLLGRNTDVDGIKGGLLSTLPEAERRKKKPFGEGRSAIIIGGGGTTRAAIYALSILGLSPIHLINRDPIETASIIASFPQYDLRALDSEEKWTTDDAERVACGVGAIPSFEPQTEGEKMVYRVAEKVFETSGKYGKRPLMEMAYKPHQTLMFNLAARHGWQPVGGIEALVHQAAAQQRHWLLNSPSTRIPGLTEDKLAEAARKGGDAVRREAGAPGHV